MQRKRRHGLGLPSDMHARDFETMLERAETFRRQAVGQDCLRATKTLHEAARMLGKAEAHAESLVDTTRSLALLGRAGEVRHRILLATENTMSTCMGPTGMAHLRRRREGYYY